MLLQLDDNKYIPDLQDKFNECFTFLKIEFYNTKHKWQEVSEATHLIDPKTLIGTIRKKTQVRIIGNKIIVWDWKGGTGLKKKPGLNVQVFRLQDNQWIQTSSTDELTLQEQNELARSMIYKEELSVRKE